MGFFKNTGTDIPSYALNEVSTQMFSIGDIFHLYDNDKDLDIMVECIGVPNDSGSRCWDCVFDEMPCDCPGNVINSAYKNGHECYKAYYKKI